MIEQVQQDIGMPLGVQTRFQGAAEAFQASLSSTLLLILAAVVTMYIVLGCSTRLHPPGDHPLDAAFGGGGCCCWRCCSAATTWA